MDVLVVEDEAIVALDMQMSVIEVGHSVVGLAGNALDALQLVQDHVPDLAFVDINLKGATSGTELAKHLKEEWGVLCIFVTANADVAFAHQDAALGVIQKPFTIEAVIDSISVAKAVTDGQVPHVRAHNGLTLFPQQYAA